MSIGGGGGGLLGAIGGIVGTVFGGPIGAIVGQMLGQIVQSVVGQVLQQVGQELGNVTQQGMQSAMNAFGQEFNGGQSASASGLNPTNLVDSLIRELGGGTAQQSSNLHGAVDNLQKAISDFVNQFMQDTVQSDRHGHKGGARGGAGADGGAGAGAVGGDVGNSTDIGSSSDSSGDDFFIAMAKGLGKAMQKQADKVKALSDQIGSGDDKKESETQTKLMGESSKMQFLGQAVQTALSSVGQALGTLARKD